VYKINRSGRIVATYETGDGARDMSYADGTLWVVNQDVGTVTGIDAATGVTRTFRFGHPLQTLAALKGKLLVSVNRGRTYQDRIDSLDGEVARLFGPIYEFDHPDPAISGNGFVHSFIFQAERATCAPLLGYPDVPPPRGQQLVPEVAATMPRISRDRRTYTFTVKPGFRFAPPSNAKLDTRTFRFSIERALNPKLGSRAPGIDFLGDVEGARAFHAGRATHVSGIRVHDDRISFTLRNPSPDFLERLALPYFCPVPRGTVIKADGVGVYTGPAPPGAGPYSFSGWVWNGEYEILQRNPNYGGTRPQHLDAIAFREGIDTEKAVERVEHGGWGGIQDYNPVLGPGGEIARRFGEDPRAAVSHQTFPQAVTSYIALNARSGPLVDPRLRRALALGLARPTLAANGNDVATNQLLPVAVRGAKTPRLGDVDVGRARRLVGARHLSLNMAVQASDETSSHMADLVRAQLAPLGIGVQPRVVPDLAAALRHPGQDIHLAVLTTSLDYPDPASFLTRMLGHDVPASWLPPTTRAAVARLGLRTGAARDRAAVVLAARLETRDVPVVAFGTQELGVVLGRSLGCRVWNGVDAGLDLAALCLPGS